MSDSKLSADIDYTRSEVVRAALILYAERTRLWWLLAGLLVVVFNPFWPNPREAMTYWRDDTLGFLLFVISAMWPPMGLIFVTRGAQRVHATYEALGTKSRIVLDDRGITVYAKGRHGGEDWESEQRTQWATLKNVRDLGWGLLFLRDDKRYQIVPKRCLDDPSAWKEKLIKVVPVELRRF
jgi:hypothetical protein